MSLWLSLAAAGILLLTFVRFAAKADARRARSVLRAGLVTLGGLLAFGLLLQLAKADCGVLPALWTDPRLQALQALMATGVLGNAMWDAFRLRQLRRGAVLVRDCENPLRTLPLELSDRVRAPSLWSLLRPRVLFPRLLWTRLSVEARTLILRHEEAHALGHDLWWRGLSRLLLAFSLGHPVLWVLHRELIRLDEFVADDWALEKTQARKSDLVRLFLSMPGELSKLHTAAQFPGEMRARAERLVQTSRSGTSFRRPALLAIFLVWMTSAMTASAFEARLLKAEFGPEGFELHRTEIRLSVLNPLLASANSMIDQPQCRRNP